jgi:protein ImuA
MTTLKINQPIDIAHVWRAGELGAACAPTIATGYAALSCVLPGGGWPCGAMTEVLQLQPGQHEWGLLAPALGALQAESPDSLVVLVGAPYCPFGPALSARQLNMQRVLNIHATKNDSPAMLWATREALQCADVAAVLAWLPDARSAHLRRLQIAAQTHNKLLFVFRRLAAQHESSPAPLRLRLAGTVQPVDAAACNLQIEVFKRRGPLLGAPVLIDTRPARLAALLAASRERVHQHTPQTEPASALFDMSGILRKQLHALDRTASLQH